MPLGNILVEMGIITNDELVEYLIKQKETNKRLGELILEDGKVSEDVLYEILEKEFNIKFFDRLPEPDPSKVNLLFSILNLQFCKEKMVAPLDENGEFITVAMDDPSNFSVINEIRFISGKYVEVKFARTRAIREYLEIASEILLTGKFDITKYSRRSRDNGSKKVEVTQERKEDSKVINLANSIIQEGVDRKASDIHLEIYENEVVLRYRIDGKLYRFNPPPLEIYGALVSRIKIMSNLDISERRLPQDGVIKFFYNNEDIDIRVSVIPGVFGENVVMRILRKDSNLISDLSYIGMDNEEIEIYKKALQKANGMILVTGPTGSGKTTTLYAGIMYLRNFEKKIITAEDPVEYHVSGVEQIQINQDIGFTFAEALRAFLRHDPDVIMVGEIRDHETAEIAVRSALTGHLVLSTLHTNDAASTLTRLVDMGIEPYLVSSTVNLIIAQRLVRKLCPYCKKEINITSLEIGKLKMLEGKLKPGDKVFVPQECNRCNKTGFSGRIPIFELLEVDEEIREVISSGLSSSKIKEIAVKNGMKTLLDSGISKVKKGLTTIEEIIGVV